MKILIVGGGAVGQVFGYLLHRGGADITYLLKPQYLQETKESGFTLYNARTGECHAFVDFVCIANLTEEQSFDQVWITVASDACRGDWWQQLLSKIDSSTVIYFQPDLENKQRITAVAAVQGMIQFIAYQSPLPNETDPKLAQRVGVTYYLPPLLPMAVFASKNDTTKSIQQILAKAQVKVALASADWLSFRYAKIAALSIPAMAVLETVDWSLLRFRQRSTRRLARRAIHQALQVACAHYQRRYCCYGPLISIFVWILGYSNMLVPLIPMERFLQFHFTKVGPQTRMMLRQYIDHGNDLSMDTNTLAQLLNTLEPEAIVK